MIYDESTKKELDAILKAFENYIDGQNYFDIVYSKKIRRDRNMGDNLRRLRKSRHISQEKLCAELQRRGVELLTNIYYKIFALCYPLLQLSY